ncbi:MAG TPA: acyl-CoA thioester hydrolase/BAAT C-terminal domain-containing protein [Myxococcota bacterium]|nr:acyl-CoA thioester hydrolase/BAAT C-terminal domain-containing protein [Myxococcota bacterium]
MFLAKKLSKATMVFILLVSSGGCFAAHFYDPPNVLVQEDDVWAKYAEPKEITKDPVLFVGGSEGGLPTYFGAYYDLGHPVLALGYFSPNGADAPSFIPKEFDRIPLELIGNGLSWLHKKFPDKKIAVVAGSKGAEAVMAFASTSDRRVALIDKALLISGGAYAFEGVLKINTKEAKNSGHSAWTFQSAEIPFVKNANYDSLNFVDRKLKHRDYYERALSRANSEGSAKKAVFTLDNLNHAKILFICGKNDMVWASCEMIKEVINATPDKANLELLELEEAGHVVFYANKDSESPSPVLLGNTSEAAVKKAKGKTREFLKN